jgi:heme/copper-type cytochrome/quinol oxidase subunit 3
MNAIPYTVERRPDTGVNNVQLGVWLFLASEVMLFGGLFSAYFMLRAGAPAAWATFVEDRSIAIINTAVLLGAGAALAAAVRCARRREIVSFRRWMVATIVLGVLFCGLKGLDYFDFYAMHWLPSTSTRYATYYLLTGVHALHVLGGVVVNGRVLLTPTSTWVQEAPAVTNRVEAAALYWYFVDAVWLVLFVLLYVV